MKVLIIDDDKQMARATKRLLGKEYNCTLSDGVSSGLKEIGTADYDVVISDWDMPGGGGAEILKRSWTPVVIYTGSMIDIKGLVVRKPFEIAELKKVLQEAVDNG